MVAIFSESRDFIRKALAEDIGHGDITSTLIIGNEKADAVFIAKEKFTLAGMPFVKEVFGIIDDQVRICVNAKEGALVNKGDILANIDGSAQSLLACERVALNILQHLSGIATAASEFIDRVKGLPVRIVDTRKTTPCMRAMEKYAVVIGGAFNHRFGLYDGILIKDNHIETAGGIEQAVSRAKNGHHLLKIEVEVKNLNQVRQALESGVDVIMLDNMNVDEMKKAVDTIRSYDKKILIEASGNVSLENIRAIAQSGVDIISVGAITHSARAVDISMKIRSDQKI